MRRSQERLTEIDNYLNEHYPKEGSKVCSVALNEGIGYIQSRVQLLRLKRDTPANNKKKAVENSQVAILEGKLSAKNNEIKELWELLKDQRTLNSELRIENIRLINEKVKARRDHV